MGFEEGRIVCFVGGVVVGGVYYAEDDGLLKSHWQRCYYGVCPGKIDRR